MHHGRDSWEEPIVRDGFEGEKVVRHTVPVEGGASQQDAALPGALQRGDDEKVISSGSRSFMLPKPT